MGRYQRPFDSMDIDNPCKRTARRSDFSDSTLVWVNMLSIIYTQIHVLSQTHQKNHTK
jgi:hypothetical protein